MRAAAAAAAGDDALAVLGSIGCWSWTIYTVAQLLQHM
jgi:hypothetical protein